MRIHFPIAKTIKQEHSTGESTVSSVRGMLFRQAIMVGVNPELGLSSLDVTLLGQSTFLGEGLAGSTSSLNPFKPEQPVSFYLVRGKEAAKERERTRRTN